VPHTLLLADDSVTIQRVIELTFADEDVTVVAVSDGDQAIERLEASPPDIVLADIGMPGKSGYEVAQYMRRSPRLEHIPVVLLTGAFEPVDQARADDAGCDGVLAKPFEPQMVIGRVKELLGRPQRSPAAPSSQHWSAARNVDAPAPPPPDLNSYFDRLDTAFGQASPDAASGATADEVHISPQAAPPTGLDWFSGLAQTDRQEPSDSAGTTEAPLDLPLTASLPQIEALAGLKHAPQEQLAKRSDVEPIPAPEPPVDSASTGSAPSVESARTEEAHGHDAAPPIVPVEPMVAAESMPATFFAAAEIAAPVVPSAPPLEVPLKNSPTLPPLADAFAALLAAEKGGTMSPGAAWPAVPSSPAASDEMIESIARRVLERLSDAVVRQTVSDIAERLVREEIERIRASIK
jgi:CheY-like chemotaxis protein